MLDHQSFIRTAVPHKDVLHNYALHLTMNPENAKDLLQETYLKAFRFWNKYEQGTNIKGWLYRIMKNSYINLYRKKIKEPRNVEYDENHFSLHTNQITTLQPRQFESKSYKDLFADEIVHAIDALPIAYKTIFLLSDVDDLNYKQIAKKVGCPIGTVRSRLHRSRIILRKKLFEYALDGRHILPSD